LLGVVELGVDHFFRGAQSHADHIVAQLDLGLLGLDLEILQTFFPGRLGVTASLGHDVVRQLLAALDRLLDPFALENLDVDQLRLEARFETLGRFEGLLGVGVILLDLLPPLVEQIEDRPPGVLRQDPDHQQETDECRQ